MSEDVMAILDLVGLRPVVVDGLGADAVLSLEAGVLLLDQALSAEDVADVVDQALMMAAAALPAT